MDDDKGDVHALDAFEGLLESISNLEIIDAYVCRMTALPKVASIINHKKTLRSLSIHSQANKDTIYHYSQEDFTRLCSECSGIRQLAVTFPRTSVETAQPSAEFKTYVVSLAMCQGTVETKMSTQGITQRLRNLRTLNIRRWPASQCGFVGSYYRVIDNLHLYEHHLQRISQYIFEINDEDARANGYGLGNRSHLSVICWGGNGKTRHDSNDRYKLKQIPFVRGTKIDPFGQTSMLAVQTVWRMVQFVEPESEILNHSVRKFGVQHD